MLIFHSTPSCPSVNKGPGTACWVPGWGPEGVPARPAAPQHDRGRYRSTWQNCCCGGMERPRRRAGAASGSGRRTLRALSRPQVIPQESGLAGQSGEMAECVPAAPVTTAESLAGWPRGRRCQGVVVGPIIRCPWLDQVLEFVHRRQAAAMNHETGRPRTRLASERRVGQYQTRLASQAQGGGAETPARPAAHCSNRPLITPHRGR
jgi:hypothetical protein